MQQWQRRLSVNSDANKVSDKEHTSAGAEEDLGADDDETAGGQYEFVEEGVAQQAGMIACSQQWRSHSSATLHKQSC